MDKSILVGLRVLAISTSAASASTHHQSYRNGYRAHHSSAYRATRPAQREAVSNGAYNNDYYGPGYARSGFWPGDVAGAAVGTAGAIAAGGQYRRRDCDRTIPAS
jgi:hypothetical protein